MSPLRFPAFLFLTTPPHPPRLSFPPVVFLFLEHDNHHAAHVHARLAPPEQYNLRENKCCIFFCPCYSFPLLSAMPKRNGFSCILPCSPSSLAKESSWTLHSSYFYLQEPSAKQVDSTSRRKRTLGMLLKDGQVFVCVNSFF